jgi:hypothetical protein
MISKRWLLLPVGLGLATIGWQLAAAERVPKSEHAYETSVPKESTRSPNAEVAFLASQVAGLNTQLGALRSEMGALRSQEPRSHGSEEPTAKEDDGARAAQEADPDEELLNEQDERKADELITRYLEKFESEPTDTEWSAPREGEIRATFSNSEFSGLFRNVSCKWTMCRVELDPSESTLPALWNAGGFAYGGYARKKEDGTVVLLAGREGFPFHETNHLEPRELSRPD